MDYSLYRSINGLSGHQPLDHLFTLLAGGLPAILVVAVALLFLIPWRNDRRPRRAGAVAATLAAALALVLNQVLAAVIDRVRPYAAHPGHAHLLIARSPDPSFPSDHATGAFAIALAVLAYDRAAGVVLVLLAALLSFARVYVGTHYPGDILGGILTAALVVAVLLRTPLRRRVERLAAACSDLWDRLPTALPSARRTRSM